MTSQLTQLCAQQHIADLHRDAHHARLAATTNPQPATLRRKTTRLQLKWTPSQVKRRLERPDAVFHQQGRISGYEYDAAEVQVDFDVQQQQDRAFLIAAPGTSTTSFGVYRG